MRFPIDITDPAKLAGITAARAAYNDGLPDQLVDGKPVTPKPGTLATDQEYVQYIVDNAAASYVLAFMTTEAKLAAREAEVQSTRAALAARDATLANKDASLAARDAMIQQRDADLAAEREARAAAEDALATAQAALAAAQAAPAP